MKVHMFSRLWCDYVLQVRDKRLRALEADNYNEEMHVETAIEDNYSSQESVSNHLSSLFTTM